MGLAMAAEKIAPTLIQNRRVAKRRKQPGQPQAPASPRYAAMIGIITGLTPMLFLVLLELALRVVGFSNPYPLFINSPGVPGYMQVNPDVVKRFLVQQSPSSAMQADTIFFLKDKPADDYHIFVLCEPSAADFPYGRFVSLACLLDQPLRRTFPE